MLRPAAAGPTSKTGKLAGTRKGGRSLPQRALERFYPNTMSCEPSTSGLTIQEEFSQLSPSLLLHVHRWQDLIYSRFPPTGPSADQPHQDYSVYTGTAGVAYMYLYLYLTTTRVTISTTAVAAASNSGSSATTAPKSREGGVVSEAERSQLYLQRGLEYARASVAAVAARRHKKGQPTERDITFLTGDAGPFAISAILHDIAGEPDTVTDLLDRLRFLHQPCLHENFTYNELLYGRSGYLYAALLANRYFGRDIISPDIIHRIAEIILIQGRSGKRSERLPLMWQWHGKEYLGGAHGVAGILYLLLQIESIASDRIFLDEAKRTAVYLCENAQWDTGNFMSSLNKTADHDYLVQWCHGAPGILPMLLMLRQASYSLAQTESHAENSSTEAVIAGLECIWERGLLRKGMGLCHGIAGNMYPFLYAYEHALLFPNSAEALDGDKQFRRAMQFARFLVRPDTEQQLLMAPDHPFSLFEGLAGATLALQNLAVEPSIPRFPSFDSIIDRCRRVIK